MKVNNENFDKVLNKLVASTRSPRGRFTAENSWRLLESRLLKRRSMKRFWMRTASAAAVVLLCVTSWAALSVLIRSTTTGSHSHRSHTYYRGNPSNP